MLSIIYTYNSVSETSSEILTHDGSHVQETIMKMTVDF